MRPFEQHEMEFCGPITGMYARPTSSVYRFIRSAEPMTGEQL